MSASGFRVVLRSLRYPQKFRGHEESWVCAQTHVSLLRFCLNTGRLCSAGSGCRARSPPSSLICGHPTPHAASARLRFALGRALPVAQALVLCATTLRREAGRRSACCRRRVGVGHRFSVARILRLDGQGSPRLPGHPLRPCRSRPPRRSPFGSPLAPPGVLLSRLVSP